MAAPFKGIENHSYKKSETDNEVLKTLNILFGNVLHADVIKSVALNCKWHLETASNILAELSSTVTNDRVLPQIKKKNSTSNINSIGYAAAGEDTEADVLIEDEFDNASNTHMRSRSHSKPFVSRAFVPTKNKILSGRSSSVDKKHNSAKPVQPKQVQNKSKKVLEYDRVRKHILTGAKVLVLLRGLPGSGKSHLAKMLVSSTIREDYRTFVFSTDDYFVIRGLYNFNPMLVSEAHGWNQKRVYDVMRMGMSPVIVDNTNTQIWEMRTYAIFAIEFGYAVEILEPNTPWVYNPSELARRNCHNVPKAKIIEMLERYEKKITPDRLFAMYNLKYIPTRYPPQPRLYPPLHRNIPPLLNIPVNIRRNISPDNSNNLKSKSVTARKTRRPKKKKTELPNDDKLKTINKTESFELLKSESVSSMQSNEYSTSSDSDTESLPPHEDNNTSYKMQDLLSTDINECTEYVLVLPDNTFIYQKNHSGINNANAKKENIDLINFNDGDDNIKSTYSLDLINLNINKNVDKIADNNSNKECDSSTTNTLYSLEQEMASVSVSGRKEYNEKEQNIAAATSSSTGTYPKIDLSSWGLTDDALISWETVDKHSAKDTQYTLPQPQRHLFKDLVTESVVTPKYEDASTNTSSYDFNLSKRNYIDTTEGKIVPAYNRVITEYCLASPPKLLPFSAFDKSTMTGNEYSIAVSSSKIKSNNEEQHFSELLHLFPNTSKDDLKDIFDKCQGDINWAVDLLLDSNVSPSENLTKENYNVNTTVENVQKADSESEAQLLQQDAATNSDQQSRLINIGNKKSLNKTRNKFIPSEGSTEIKKQLEEQFKINETYYSEHLLNLRRRKYGEVDSVPSTSKNTQININEPTSETIEANTSPANDIESENSSEDEIVEMNVGMNFVEQLEKTVGFGHVVYPEGFQPVLLLPTSLLKQLHAYWLESVHQQIEAHSFILESMVREDEEFARKLQEEEAGKQHEDPVVPDLQEIMDMEIALAIYRADQEQWKNETPDDLATRMKKQKLFETFPNFDPNTLTEILQAYNNSFEQTMEVLSTSVSNAQINVDKTGAHELAKQKELIENAKKEYIQAKQAENTSEEASDDERDDCCSAEQSANDYREQASHHLKMRQQCYSKAQAALQKKLTSVAAYYSEVAKLHKQKYEHANSRAASAFLSAHSFNHQDSNTLDLHYLYVKEAEQALALFIDTQISKLKELKKQKETIFIITGRGKRSRHGISHIKPAVERKLQERKLEYLEMNPGLLKVNITKHSIMTNDLKG